MFEITYLHKPKRQVRSFIEGDLVFNNAVMLNFYSKSLTVHWINFKSSMQVIILKRHNTETNSSGTVVNLVHNRWSDSSLIEGDLVINYAVMLNFYSKLFTE